MTKTGADNSSASKESRESTIRVGIEDLNDRLERLRGNLDNPSDEIQEQVWTAPVQDLQEEEPLNLGAEGTQDMDLHTVSGLTAQLINNRPMTMLHSSTAFQEAPDMFGDSPNAQ